MYKITFELDSSVCFTDRINFDALVVWAYYKHTAGDIPQSLMYNKNSLPDPEGLIPLKYENGVAVASTMYYNENDTLEWTDYLHKEWCNKYDYYADMKNGAEVDVSMGAFKSYEIPINLTLINKVWFYFDTNNLDFLKELLGYIYCLGKKRNRGKGKIKGYEIEKIDMDFFDEVRRPIPLRFTDIKKYEGKKFEIKRTQYKTPYWDKSAADVCICPI